MRTYSQNYWFELLHKQPFSNEKRFQLCSLLGWLNEQPHKHDSRDLKEILFKWLQRNSSDSFVIRHFPWFSVQSWWLQLWQYFNGGSLHCLFWKFRFEFWNKLQDFKRDCGCCLWQDDSFIMFCSGAIITQVFMDLQAIYLLEREFRGTWLHPRGSNSYRHIGYGE